VDCRWHGTTYTDTGLIRSLNEDSVLEKNAEQLWAVADGMGGHSAGDYASQHVVNTLTSYQRSKFTGHCLSSHDRAIEGANSHLIEKAMVERSGVIGCTLASLIIEKGWAICSWSGDSRIYRLRNGKLKLLTQDHSQECEFEDRNIYSHGNQIPTDSQALIAAIGGEKETYLERAWYGTEKSDQYLLCTDGLYKEANDTEIEQLMNDAATSTDAIKGLVAVYHERGARDNIGLVHVSQSPD